MRSKRNRITKRRGNNKNKSKKRTNKKMVSAVDLAQSVLKKTGSLEKARIAFRLKALQNSRKMFGHITEQL